MGTGGYYGLDIAIGDACVVQFIKDNRNNSPSGGDASIVIYDEGDLVPWLHHLV